MSTKFISLLFLSLFFSTGAFARPSQSIIQRILLQGVPADALDRILQFIDDNQGRSFPQDTYTCLGKPPEDVTPCDEAKRFPTTRYVTFWNPKQVVIVDYGAPSTDYRFYLINLLSGEVKYFYSAHGVGSGKSNYATKFSDIKNSRQTSLGIFMTGEVYKGSYGNTMRMYGLQSSNAQAYNRDIVLHGAWYVSEQFINSKDPTTGEAYGRLGVSWGCPAVELSYIASLIKTLGYGSLIMHYRNSLMDLAQGGQEVSLP
ncbi:murein L,D-transpeptidase catalytic domain family protein [Bdellovibrio sp. NC01]|uniref:murein L,D-transpeptidase catalytic domain family protein n=1 Tax=Bdellovibrio sp. NC01 TaxID=2220073 RepID=UPI001FEF62E5|nr:murein L,D-transpeptidase catalytic domain family protein [Bdellovibrio sp. NC01]